MDLDDVVCHGVVPVFTTIYPLQLSLGVICIVLLPVLLFFTSSTRFRLATSPVEDVYVASSAVI